MRALDLIIKKRDQLPLTKQEIDYLISAYTHDEIPDYQMAAWAMAVLLNGMTDQEITDLTMAMAYTSGMRGIHCQPASICASNQQAAPLRHRKKEAHDIPHNSG